MRDFESMPEGFKTSIAMMVLSGIAYIVLYIYSRTANFESLDNIQTIADFSFVAIVIFMFSTIGAILFSTLSFETKTTFKETEPIMETIEKETPKDKSLYQEIITIIIVVVVMLLIFILMW